MMYGKGNDNSIINEYLRYHIYGSIIQKNFDFILDLIDEYVELLEIVRSKPCITVE